MSDKRKIKGKSGYELKKVKGGVKRWKKRQESPEPKQVRQNSPVKIKTSALRAATGGVAATGAAALAAKALVDSGIPLEMVRSIPRPTFDMLRVQLTGLINNRFDFDNIKESGILHPSFGNLQENMIIGGKHFGKVFSPADVEPEKPGQGIAAIFERESRRLVEAGDYADRDAVFQGFDLINKSFSRSSLRHTAENMLADRLYYDLLNESMYKNQIDSTLDTVKKKSAIMSEVAGGVHPSQVFEGSNSLYGVGIHSKASILRKIADEVADTWSGFTRQRLEARFAAVGPAGATGVPSAIRRITAPSIDAMVAKERAEIYHAMMTNAPLVAPASQKMDEIKRIAARDLEATSPDAAKYIESAIKNLETRKKSLQSTSLLMRGMARAVYERMGINAIDPAEYITLLNRSSTPVQILRSGVDSDSLSPNDMKNNLQIVDDSDSHTVALAYGDENTRGNNFAITSHSDRDSAFWLQGHGMQNSVIGSSSWSIPNMPVTMMHEAVHVIDENFRKGLVKLKGGTTTGAMDKVRASQLDRSNISKMYRARVKLASDLVTIQNVAGMIMDNMYVNGNVLPDSQEGRMLQKLRSAEVPEWISNSGRVVKVDERKATELTVAANLVTPFSAIPGVGRLDYALMTRRGVKGVVAAGDANREPDGSIILPDGSRAISAYDYVSKMRRQGSGGYKDIVDSNPDDLGPEVLTTLTEAAVMAPHIINSLDLAFGTTLAQSLEDFYGTDIRTKENPKLRNEIDTMIAKYVHDTPGYMEELHDSVKGMRYDTQFKIGNPNDLIEESYGSRKNTIKAKLAARKNRTLA